MVFNKVFYYHNILNQYRMTDDKNYIIDPLTAICKVALLDFMNDGTKLAINHHILNIQEYTYSQWIERMKNGDSRRDISNLSIPFIKAIKWYILDNPEKIIMDKTLSDSILTITDFTIKGLYKLQNHTYQSDKSIRIILQYFINLFKSATDGTWNEETVIKTENDHNILTDKIKNNYDPNTINSIAKMLLDAQKIKLSNIDDKTQDDINVLIDCSHKLLINRDAIFIKMMKDINTNL